MSAFWLNGSFLLSAGKTELESTVSRIQAEERKSAQQRLRLAQSEVQELRRKLDQMANKCAVFLPCPSGSHGLPPLQCQALKCWSNARQGHPMEAEASQFQAWSPFFQVTSGPCTVYAGN